MTGPFDLEYVLAEAARAHLEAMPGAGIGCPTCRHAADDPLHKCRHGVLSGAS